MARVNINFEPVPEVAPTGAPGNDYFHIQAEPAAFGAPVAKGLQTLGQGVEHGAEAGFEVAQFFGRVNVDDQTNKFIDARNRILYGDPNKQILGPDGKPSVDRGFMGLEGRAASDQRQATLQALQEARTAGLQNLTSPRDRLAYDSETRRMYAEAEGHIGQHTDNQWKVWAQGVNHAGANHELDSFVNALDDPAKARDYAKNFINFRVQQAQLKFGDDPQIKDEAAAEARRDLLEAHVNAVAVKDPAGAIKLLEANKAVAGVKYDDIYNRLRNRADTASGTAAANAAIARATGVSGAAPTYARSEVAGSVTSAWRSQGMSQNGIAGVMFNINEESGFNPNLRHPDQPRFSSDDERHYAHGLYQEGAEEWSRYENWIKTNHPGADWRDHRLQSEFAAWNLKTNYPGTWARMNAAGTPEEAAAIYAREYLRPSAENLQSRLTKINRGIGSAESYGAGGAAYTPAVASTGGPSTAPAAPDRHLQLANALRDLESNPDLSEKARDDGRRVIQQEFHILELIDNQKTKVKTEAANKAAGGYVTELADMMHTPNPDYVALSGRIAHDPALAEQPHLIENLLDRVRHVSGEEQALAFGPGYLQAREALFSPPDAPGHINDFSELVNRRDITLSGLEDLHKRMTLVKGDVDHGAVERRMNSYLRFAKKNLSFEEDNGFFKIRDVKGEGIYSGQFEPDFVKRVSDLAQEAQRTGDRKKLDEFLSLQNVEKMVEQYRPRREMAADRMAAQPTADQPEAANAPLPPIPEGSGISDAGWKEVMGKTPIGANGNPMSHALWADILTTLNSNPTPEVMAKFDRRYGPLGFQAADVLKTINPAAAIAAEKSGHIGPEEAEKPAPAAAPAPAPAAPPPAAPEPPAPPAGETPEQRRERYRQESAAPVEQQQREAAEREAEQTARGPGEREAAFAATAERQEQRVNRPRLAEAQTEREKQRTQERVADLQQQEQLLADNIRTWRRAQEDRSASPADRDRAARRADKLQTELDAAKAEREKLSKEHPPLDHGAHAEWRDGR